MSELTPLTGDAVVVFIKYVPEQYKMIYCSSGGGEHYSTETFSPLLHLVGEEIDEVVISPEGKYLNRKTIILTSVELEKITYDVLIKGSKTVSGSVSN